MAEIIQTGNRWEVTGDISMDNANTLLAASGILSMSNDTLVDFAKVKDVDTAAISLLLEWQRRAIAENQQLKFINFPASLISLAQLYGVADLIK